MDLFIPLSLVWVILRYRIILLDRRVECAGYVFYVASISRHAPSGDVQVEPKYEVKSTCIIFFFAISKGNWHDWQFAQDGKRMFGVGEETKFEVPVIKQEQGGFLLFSYGF